MPRQDRQYDYGMRGYPQTVRAFEPTSPGYHTYDRYFRQRPAELPHPLPGSGSPSRSRDYGRYPDEL